MEIINNELNKLDEILFSELSIGNLPVSDDIKNFIFSKSKKIRASLIFLFTKALNLDCSNDIHNLACSVELLHNATLIHDDIIDNSDFRRGKLSLNKKLGNNLSVLSGDLILSIAMKKLAQCNTPEIINIFSNSLFNMCKGEINQYFTINQIPDYDTYIKKSKAKTSELFISSLHSLCKLKNINQENEIINFASNFGIAFQIKDDLTNILSTDSSKPCFSDIYNGIYTLPVIYLAKKISIPQTKEDIIDELRNHPEVIEQTKSTINEFTEKAINSISFIPENEYKQTIIKLADNLYFTEPH